MIAALVTAFLTSGLARAESAVLVDKRPNQPPTYCRSEQDYANRLSVQYPSAHETADYFDYSKLKVSLDHGNVTIRGRVTFYSCAKLGHGKYGWVAHKAGEDHYNLLTVPRVSLYDNLQRYLSPVDASSLEFRLELPIEQFLTTVDLDRYRDGKPVRAIEIFSTFLPSGYTAIRRNTQNPAQRLFVDFLP